MSAIVTAILGAYAALRIFGQMPLPIWARVLLGLLAMALAFNYPLTKLAFGNMFSAELPRAVVIAISFGFGTLLILTVLHVLLDLGALVRSLVIWRWAPVPVAGSIAVLVVALALSGWGVSNAIRQPALKRLEVAIADLPQGFDGYRMVHLTDIHLSRIFQRPFAEELVARVNALAPDLIVISGDLIDGYLDARRDDIAPLTGLQARDGVFVSPGNHEYYFDFDAYWPQYQAMGMRPLVNAHAVLERDGGALVVAGVNDLSARRFGKPAPDLEAALAGAPDAPVVLLDHQPRNARLSAAQGVDLQLSGHTHGGMVWGLNKLVAHFNEGFVSGRYQVGEMVLYVNNGTALWPGFALRLGVPSELTEITLRAAGGASDTPLPRAPGDAAAVSG